MRIFTMTAKNNMPDYFASIYSELLEMGKLSTKLQALPVFLKHLHNIGCCEKTMRTLCIDEEVLSLEQLQSMRYGFQQYLDCDISPQQSDLLARNIQHVPIAKQDNHPVVDIDVDACAAKLADFLDQCYAESCALS